jgi:hypothetical protein
MAGKKQGVEETPQQRAMNEHAVNQWADWKQRWLPVQKNLSNSIQRMGKEGSFERETAQGRASTDSAIQFQRAEGALEKSLTDSGAKAGSSKFNLASAGLSTDKAKSKGLGMTMADQMIDDAYIQGLQSITSIGRGERAQVADSMGAQAAASSRQANADAEASLMNRAGNAQVIGQVAGFGIQRGLSGIGTNNPTGSVPGGYVAPDGRQFNNPSAYTPLG